jgi:voltage-gated potassium channel
MSAKLYRKFLWPGLVLVAILTVGSTGYWLLGGRQDSLMDVIYMTVITITTIGFTEVIDLTGNPGGRAFTIFIAVAGIGLIGYMVTSFTALLVEGELTKSFRRRKMEKMARQASNHYIICGLGGVGRHVAGELRLTGRRIVAVDLDAAALEDYQALFAGQVSIQGDATDNDTLLKAGIERASGVFAITGDDNQNLVISFTAKQINPAVRVVARCTDTKNIEKIQQTGAEAVVSPGQIGGLRMASEMVRPTVVSFLDIMLRDREKNLRIEEAAVPARIAGQPLAALGLERYPRLLLLAVRRGDGWEYHPAADYPIEADDRLVFMTTPEVREQLESVLAGE